MEICLKVENLNLFVGQKQIITNLDFSLPKGKTIAIVGESGAGKSMIAQTVIQCLPKAAYVSKSSSVKLGQQELIGLSERDMCKIRGKDIGLIFQDAMAALNPVIKIGKQLTEVLKIHTELNEQQCYKKIISLLDDVGIKNPEMCYQSYPHQLSGGMLQRALIASVLAAEPKLLIADEPTTALDVTIQAKLVRLLASLQKSYNCSLVFISHDLLLVKDIADYVLVLKHGKLVEFSAADDFFKQPKSEYSQQLLAASTPNDKLQTPIESNNLLEVAALSVEFKGSKQNFWQKTSKIKAVDRVSFEIKQGATLAVVGESGSGKTSLAKALLGIYPRTGRCYWNAKINPKTDLAVVFQTPFSSMNPRMTVEDILSELWHARPELRPQSWRQELCSALEEVGLSKLALDKYPHQFSGGERQRLCIARAIVGNPKMIILDEPTSALDVSIQAVIVDMLINLQRKKGYTYMLITHDFVVVKKMANYVIVMQNGSIVEQGNVEQVLRCPQQDYTKQLLAAVPGEVV